MRMKIKTKLTKDLLIHQMRQFLVKILITNFNNFDQNQTKIIYTYYQVTRRRRLNSNKLNQMFRIM